MSYTFKSEYGEEDILYSLEVLCQEELVTSATLVSRVRIRPLKADHQCTVMLKLATGKNKNFYWPDEDMFREVQRL